MRHTAVLVVITLTISTSTVVTLGASTSAVVTLGANTSPKTKIVLSTMPEVVCYGIIEAAEAATGPILDCADHFREEL